MPEYVDQNGILVPAEQAAPQYARNVHAETREFLRPLVDAWMRKINLAEKAKAPFNEVAKRCDMFFSKSGREMWGQEYRLKYIGNIGESKFQVQLQKAFELVALFGPYLFWQYPHVRVENYEPLDIIPELFGDVENDQMAQMMYQQQVQRQQMNDQTATMRNRLMERYLNYSQREQPGGGLAVEAEMCITEALVKGRGVLGICAKRHPASQRLLTRRRYIPVDNFGIDGDCTDPLLSSAQFIYVKHRDPAWKVEKKFNLPKGYLRNVGALSYNDSLRMARGPMPTRYGPPSGSTSDSVDWFETWSRAGVGTKLSPNDGPDAQDRDMMGPELADRFEEVVGDHAYLALCANVPFPLNAPSSLFRDPKTGEPRATDDEVVKMFSWRCVDYGPPFPAWADERWPVNWLDFYPYYGSAWPIAPLAPALGELTALNILVSAFLENAWENRKQIIAYLESAAKNLKSVLETSDNPAFVALNDTQYKRIQEVIQFLHRPDMNNDPLQAIEFVLRRFEERSGLTEFMYAMQVTQDRTARSTAAKEEKASIRPEKMSRDVAKWLTQSAQSELFAAAWLVVGQDLRPLLGEFGVQAWDQLITAVDPDVLIHEMTATVEASDIRKPNLDRLRAAMQEALQYLLPVLQQYAVDTGDTTPINTFFEKMNRAMEEKGVMPQLNPWRPEPDPQQQAFQLEQAQLEQAEKQAELTLKQIEAQIKKLELQESGVDVQKAGIDMQKAQVELQRDLSSGGNDFQKRQLDLAFDQLDHLQELRQDEERHRDELDRSREEFLQSLLQKRREGEIKVDQMHAEARARRQQAVNSNGR